MRPPVHNLSPFLGRRLIGTGFLCLCQWVERQRPWSLGPTFQHPVGQDPFEVCADLCGRPLCESSQWCRTWNSQWGTFRVKGVATWAEAAMRTLTLAPYMNIPGGHDPCQRRPVIARVTLCELCVSLRPSVALPGGHFPCEDCAHLGWWTLCDPACLLPLPPSILPPPTPVPPSSLPLRQRADGICEPQPGFPEIFVCVARPWDL